MAVNHQVVITLTAVNYPDDFRQRVITLTPALRVINIGRSSKSESKNLIAAEDNAWFDSPVMSREHARLWISPPDSRFVYLKDIGSMHGTSVQDRSLNKNIDHILKNGEIITFGIEVTRGQETFPAREFRVHYEWQEWTPPTPKSNSPALSSPMNNRYVVPDGTPEIVSKPLQEPSVRFRGRSSHGFSMPESDSSNPASVAEDDDLDEDGFEPLTRVAEGPSGPVNLEFEGPAGLSQEEKDADENAYSEMASTKQVGPTYSSKLGAGSSQHNPIDLDDDLCARSEIIDESDEEGPEVVPNRKISSTFPMNFGRHVLPYGYILEAPIAEEQTKGLGSDMDQDSVESDLVEDCDIEVADIFTAEDPEHMNEGETDQDIQTQANNGERNMIDRPPLVSNRVYRSTYNEPDDEDDDVSSSVDGTEDEAFASSKAALPNYGDKAEAQRSLDASKTSQSKPHPTLLVEDSQSQAHGAPRMSTGAILDVSYQLHVDDRLEPGRPSLSERAPSPSDAALAKTSAGTDSQSLHNPNERYSYGENALRRLQNNHNNSKLPATTHIATGNENISHITRSAPFVEIKPRGSIQVNYGTSHRHDKAWEAPDTDQTHYSDGPFKLDAPPMPPPMVAPDRLPALVGQDTSSSLQHSGHNATDGFYRENVATKVYDRFFDEEQVAPTNFSSLCGEFGHQWLQGYPYASVNSYFNTQTHRPGNAVPYTPHTSTCKAEGHGTPFPIAAKAASRLSIDALVEKNSSKSTTQIVGTKRKADEISSTPEELTYSPSFSQSSNAGIDLENTSLPDAQPRDVSDLAVQASSSQSTETSSKHSYSTASMVTQEVRPKKRAKTIAKWIGTTMALGVGAIVALTATAPQSVWDEVEREMGI